MPSEFIIKAGKNRTLFSPYNSINNAINLSRRKALGGFGCDPRIVVSENSSCGSQRKPQHEIRHSNLLWYTICPFGALGSPNVEVSVETGDALSARALGRIMEACALSVRLPTIYCTVYPITQPVCDLLCIQT